MSPAYEEIKDFFYNFDHGHNIDISGQVVREKGEVNVSSQKETEKTKSQLTHLTRSQNLNYMKCVANRKES